MRIVVIRNKDDVKECDIAIIDSQDPEVLSEAKKRCKFVFLLGEKVERTEIPAKVEDFISEFELFKTIVDRLPEPVVIHDTQKILYANPKAISYIGQEGLKLNLASYIHPDYRSLAFERMQKVLNGEKVEPAEELFILPDGREVWVETNPTFVRFKGKPAILLILRDVTEKKRIEKKLEESSRKYKEFFDYSFDIIVVTDLRGNFVEVNQAFEFAFGYTNEEVKGRNFAEVLRLEKNVAEEIFRSYNLAFRERKDLRGLVFEVKRKDGRKIVVEGNIRLLWEKGKVVGFISNYRDITERIRLEKKLRESEERYRKIFENSPALIALLNEDGIFIEANQAMIRSIGMNPVGKSHYDLFPREVAERRSSYLKMAIEENKMVVFQDERENRFFFNQYIPIELEGKKHCLIISQEITEILKLNELLREVIEVHEAINKIKDPEMLIAKVEEILSGYSAKISDTPEGLCFPITYANKTYGYLCVKTAGEEEIKILKGLAESLAFVFKSIEDDKRKEELYKRLVENIHTIAYLVDGIRNPLAVMLAYVDMLIEDERVRERVFQQAERILKVMRELDVSWIKSEELKKSVAGANSNNIN
ncbi:MAG: PAS domain S-box protein [Archaeoglobaceae archaeon]